MALSFFSALHLYVDTCFSLICVICATCLTDCPFTSLSRTLNSMPVRQQFRVRTRRGSLASRYAASATAIRSSMIYKVSAANRFRRWVASAQPFSLHTRYTVPSQRLASSCSRMSTSARCAPRDGKAAANNEGVAGQQRTAPLYSTALNLRLSVTTQKGIAQPFCIKTIIVENGVTHDGLFIRYWAYR